MPKVFLQFAKLYSSAHFKIFTHFISKVRERFLLDSKESHNAVVETDKKAFF